MPEQPEPSTVESGPVTVVPVVELHPTEDLSGASNGQMSSDDGDFISIEELQKMDLDDLQKFIKDNDLQAPPEAQNNAQDLLDWLLSEFGVDA